MDVGAGIIAILISGLIVATVIDCSESRIPNWLISILLIAGTVLQIWNSQIDGFIQAVAGLVVGLGFFIPFYIFGAMGAGDVKLLGAVGLLIGPAQVAVAAIMTLMVGGLIAISYIVARGGLMPMLRRYKSMIVLIATKQPRYIPPASYEPAGSRFPYALAIACGTFLAVL